MNIKIKIHKPLVYTVQSVLSDRAKRNNYKSNFVAKDTQGQFAIIKAG